MPRNLLASINTGLLRAESDTTFLRKLRRHLPKQSSMSIICEQRVMRSGRCSQSDVMAILVQSSDLGPIPATQRRFPDENYSHLVGFTAGVKVERSDERAPWFGKRTLS